MRTASEFVPGATSGNVTEIDIAAPAGVVWQVIEELRLEDLRVTRLLTAVRSLPARLRQGSLLPPGRVVAASLLDTLTASRFVVLCREPETIVTLGIVGQFWKLSGGESGGIADAVEFVAFDRPGYVKSAIDFVLEPDGARTRLTTHTCNRATDPSAARQFRRYWRFIGPGSKAIRLDILRAVRRRAESTNRGGAFG